MYTKIHTLPMAAVRQGGTNPRICSAFHIQAKTPSPALRDLRVSLSLNIGVLLLFLVVALDMQKAPRVAGAPTGLPDGSRHAVPTSRMLATRFPCFPVGRDNSFCYLSLSIQRLGKAATCLPNSEGVVLGVAGRKEVIGR